LVLGCLHVKQPGYVQTKHIIRYPGQGDDLILQTQSRSVSARALYFHMLNTQPADGTKRWWSENKQYTPLPLPSSRGFHEMALKAAINDKVIKSGTARQRIPEESNI